MRPYVVHSNVVASFHNDLGKLSMPSTRPYIGHPISVLDIQCL